MSYLWYIRFYIATDTSVEIKSLTLRQTPSVEFLYQLENSYYTAQYPATIEYFKIFFAH